MNAVIRIIASAAVGVVLAAVLASCASSRSPQHAATRSSGNVTDFGKATRNDRLTYQVRDAREKDLVRKAEELIDAGILYYNAQDFSEAIEKFMPAQELLNKVSLNNPAIKRKLESARSYLRKSAKHHSRQLYLMAEKQFESGRKSLNMGMLDLAERALLKARELDPNIRDEVNALLRKVQEAKKRAREASPSSGHVYQTESIFGPAVYPGAKYWGLILVYAYC